MRFSTLLHVDFSLSLKPTRTPIYKNQTIVRTSVRFSSNFLVFTSVLSYILPFIMDRSKSYGNSDSSKQWNNKEQHPWYNMQDSNNASGWSSGQDSSRKSQDWKVPVKESHGNVHSEPSTEGRAITKKSYL